MVQPIDQNAEVAGRLPTALKSLPTSQFRAPRTTDLVAGWLRRKILDGELEPGTLLPPERTLAAELDVNRHTLRGALGRLESEGLLRIRQGQGATVLDYRLSGRLDLIAHFDIDQQRSLLGAFLELRRAVAVEAIALACERATAEQLAELEQLAEQQEQEHDRAAFIDRDFLFARSVLRAAVNLPMELLFNTVLAFYRQHPDLADVMFGDLDIVRPTYRATVELLRSGDAQTAREAVRATAELIDAGRLAQVASAAPTGRKKT